MKRATPQFGAALILVLWLVAALSLTVLAGARGMRQQTQQTAFDLERLRAEQLLDVARQLVVQRLLAQGTKNIPHSVQYLRIGAASVQVEVTPATGLIDVNVAQPQLLEALLHKVGGLTPDQATVMAARIKDFIDPDDQPTGPGGAEAPQYRAANHPQLPRNAALDDLTDLRAVLGMTPELYDIISPYLSINGQQRLEIMATAPALIDTLAGQAGLGTRLKNSPPDIQTHMLQSGVAVDLFVASNNFDSDMLKIRTSLETLPGHMWQRDAWVDLKTRPDALTPWTTLSLEPLRRSAAPQELNQ